MIQNTENMDPLAKALIEKGHVPYIRFDNGIMVELRWGTPIAPPYHMGMPEAIVLVALLTFLLFLVKGVPW